MYCKRYPFKFTHILIMKIKSVDNNIHHLKKYYRKSLCRNPPFVVTPHEIGKNLVINVFEMIFIAQFIN